MGYEHQGRAAGRAPFKQKIDDLCSGRLVEIARWLIGEKKRRFRRERASQSDTLLLAARQFVWVMFKPVPETDSDQFIPCPIEGLCRSRQFQRNGDIFKRGHGCDQVKGLKHNPDMLAAKRGQTVFVERPNVAPSDLDATLVGRFQTRHGHEKGRFSGTRWPDQSNRFAGGNREINAIKHMHARCVAAKRDMKSFYVDCLDHFRDCLDLARMKVTYVSLLRLAMPVWRIIRLAVVGIVLIGILEANIAQARTLTVVALGDSLTAGYLLPADQTFPTVLERVLKARGRDISIINGGVSGDTTNDGLARLDWSVPEGTDAVILELGANDMLRGLDPSIPRAALHEILSRLSVRKIPVLIAGMKAQRNLGPRYVDAFDSIYPDLAREFAAPLYPFFMDGVADDTALLQKDGLHPTHAGVERIVDRMLPVIEMFLDGRM